MIRHLLRSARALLCFSLFALPAVASAQSAYDDLVDFVYPTGRVSAADDLFVVYADQCGQPHPGERAPEVTRNGADVTVSYYLVSQPGEICFATPPPPVFVPVAIGKLAEGFHNVTRRLYVRPITGTTYELAETRTQGLTVGDIPHVAVSGWWRDPASPGWGASISLLPPIPGEYFGRAALYLATQAPNGAQRWLIGDGRFEDVKLTVSLYDAPGGTVQGTAVFTYTGCGEGKLRVTGATVHAPSGEVVVRQLTRIDGVASCEVR